MPADIATIMGKPAIAFAGQTPWHRLGTPLEGTCDVKHALEAASLDWRVDLEPLCVHRATQGHLKVPGKFAVVRDRDERVLGVVGKDYRALQNSEAAGVLEVACKKFGVKIETAGALGKGDRVWVLAKLPSLVEPVAGDKVEGYVLLYWGHNGWTPYTGRLTSVRVVCANTLGAAVSSADAVVKLKHTETEVARIEEVEKLVTRMVAALKQTGETFVKLVGKKFDRAAIEAYVNEVLGVPDPSLLEGAAATRREKILELARGQAKGFDFAPGTAWAAFNAVTEYVDHWRTTPNPKRLLDADKSALFGPNALLKAKALKLAVAA